MKKYISLTTLIVVLAIQSAFCEEFANTEKKILGSILIAGGIGAFVYETNKEIETDDSGQTKLLAVLSIVGGIVLFQSANKKTTVQFGAYGKAPILALRLEI